LAKSLARKAGAKLYIWNPLISSVHAQKPLRELERDLKEGRVILYIRDAELLIPNVKIPPKELIEKRESS